MTEIRDHSVSDCHDISKGPTIFVEDKEPHIQTNTVTQDGLILPIPWFTLVLQERYETVRPLLVGAGHNTALDSLTIL